MPEQVVAQLAICTPDDLLAQTPCFHCLSVTQLRMVELFLWATKAGYTLPDDLDDLLRDSACWNCTDVGDKRRLEGRVASLANSMTEQLGAIADIIEAMKCIPCIKLGQLDSAITYAFCQAMNQPI